MSAPKLKPLLFYLFLHFSDIIILENHTSISEKEGCKSNHCCYSLSEMQICYSYAMILLDRYEWQL
jgi:hypothetical protein